MGRQNLDLMEPETKAFYYCMKIKFLDMQNVPLLKKVAYIFVGGGGGGGGGGSDPAPLNLGP